MIPSLKSLALLACMQRSVSGPAHEYLKQGTPGSHLYQLSLLLSDHASIIREVIKNFLVMRDVGNQILKDVAIANSMHHPNLWDLFDSKHYNDMHVSRLRAFELHMETVFCVNEPLAREVQKFLKDFHISVVLPHDEDTKSFLRLTVLKNQGSIVGDYYQAVFDDGSNPFENKMILETFKRAMQ